MIFVEAINKINDSIEVKVEYAKNEIEIRIETLKNELDSINLSLNNQIVTIRDQLLSISKAASCIDIEECEESLIKLRNIIEKYKSLIIYSTYIKLFHVFIKVKPSNHFQSFTFFKIN